MKRIWTKSELTVAYYLAKFEGRGIKLHEDELAGIIDTSLGSLRMQVANFRYLLNIEGWQLEHASNAMKGLIDELHGKTMTEVKRLVQSFMREKNVPKEILDRRTHNIIVNKKRDSLNAQYERNFMARLSMLKSKRRLKKK